MTKRESVMEGLKTYNVKPPSAGTIVSTSNGPAQGASISPSRRADFFFRGNPVHTPGSGNLFKGNPRAKTPKKRASTLRENASKS
jgi:hypothetical protein